MQEQLYSIICNFELPLITFPDLEALLKMKFKDVKQMVIDMVTKFVERILDQFNILKLLKNMKKTFKQLLEEIKQKIVEQLFSCEKYKKADKSGKPSVGG
jgi:DNA integrity scanning protein DisA with diadenylate cyclase activity